MFKHTFLNPAHIAVDHLPTVNKDNVKTLLPSSPPSFTTVKEPYLYTSHRDKVSKPVSKEEVMYAIMPT